MDDITKTNDTGNEKPTASEPVSSASGEALYPAADIVSAADTLFEGKYKRQIVLAALRFAEKDAVTVSEAKKIVDEFANRKVGEA